MSNVINYSDDIVKILKDARDVDTEYTNKQGIITKTMFVASILANEKTPIAKFFEKRCLTYDEILSIQSELLKGSKQDNKLIDMNKCVVISVENNQHFILTKDLNRILRNSAKKENDPNGVRNEYITVSGVCQYLNSHRSSIYKFINKKCKRIVGEKIRMYREKIINAIIENA